MKAILQLNLLRLKKSKGKTGRGAAGKQNVAISAESIPLEDIETGKKIQAL